VRVFAVEMVYVPEGDFNCTKSFAHSNLHPNDNQHAERGEGQFYAPGYNYPVINTKLSPSLFYSELNPWAFAGYQGFSTSIRIKGDIGIDTDNNGTIDNTSYPTGYRAFFCYKYEMTEQQYADFLNTLTSTQITTLGVAGSGITLSSGQYFSSTPNKACNNATATRLFAYADWSGVRPMTFTEFNKASYGPQQAGQGYAWGNSELPSGYYTTIATNVGYLATSTSTRTGPYGNGSGSSYYGVMELTGSATEPIVRLNFTAFNSLNGNGILTSSGITDVNTWNSNEMIGFVDCDMSYGDGANIFNRGFRYVRSAE
jgi:hypothetical protein